MWICVAVIDDKDLAYVKKRLNVGLARPKFVLLFVCCFFLYGRLPFLYFVIWLSRVLRLSVTKYSFFCMCESKTKTTHRQTDICNNSHLAISYKIFRVNFSLIFLNCIRYSFFWLDSFYFLLLMSLTNVNWNKYVSRQIVLLCWSFEWTFMRIRIFSLIFDFYFIVASTWRSVALNWDIISNT